MDDRAKPLTDQNAQMLDSIEFKLITSYSSRNESPHSDLHQSSGQGESKTASTQCPEQHTKRENRKKKKKKKKIKLMKLIRCFGSTKDVKILITEDHKPQPAAYEDDIGSVVNKLANIVDSVHFIPSEIESDGDDDDIIEKIVELLRKHGDQLNEEIQKNQPLMQQLQASVSYGFFDKVAKSFMKSLRPQELPQAQSQKTIQIALICEMTKRLNVMDCHPMNRALGFGARYLQDNFTPWVNSQGGYGEVFSSSTDADEVEEIQ